MTDRYFRWQLYKKAKSLGLQGRSGGYTVKFLQDWLTNFDDSGISESNKDLFVKAFLNHPDSMELKNFREVIDLFEIEDPYIMKNYGNPKKRLILLRDEYKKEFGKTTRFRMLKRAIQRMDKADNLKKTRGGKPFDYQAYYERKVDEGYNTYALFNFFKGKGIKLKKYRW